MPKKVNKNKKGDNTVPARTIGKSDASQAYFNYIKKCFPLAKEEDCEPLSLALLSDEYLLNADNDANAQPLEVAFTYKQLVTDTQLSRAFLQPS